MKLSAPPPPPPPPPEPPAPSGQPDPTPTNAAPEAPPEAAPPPPPPEGKPLAWPAWYAGVDSALAGMVLVLAFAAASFVARNSDLWLNLAAGKRLFAGQYTPGSDPFSYSAADRAWVNHSWLYDAGAYLLYGGNGVVLVVAKALAVTLAFGLLLAIRRPQFPLWPWAACACLGVLAAVPQFQLRPLVLSMLFLSVTMFLLFRMPHKTDPKRFLIAIGVTFWLWANCDRWFFVGPLALALLVLGDFIQTKLLNSPDTPPKEGEEEPLGRLPDSATLLKALGIGVLACMLNPHHVRVWELPVELTKPAFAEVDPRLRVLNFGPTNSVFYENATIGYNLNGLAYAVLFLGGAVALGFGPGRVRVAHIALFVGFAALSLVSIYAMPFLAIVAVPLIASQLNAFSARYELKSWGDPVSRLMYLGSSGGRIVSVLAIVILCVLAYPGWVHPDTNYLPSARRVAWGVEPDPGMVAVCAQIDGWRESGKLPADARGFVTSVELANYIAWFAPREKVFANARYNHHARELPDYVTVRKGLGLFEVKDEEPKRADATEVLRKVGAGYIAIHALPSDSVSLWNRAGFATSVMYRDPGEWSPWYQDGRTSVFGWAGGAGAAFNGLRIDPVLLAFGPNVRPEPDLAPQLPLSELGWEEAFVRPPRFAPVAASETLGWLRFKDGPTARQERRKLVRERVMAPLFFGAPATAGTLHGFTVQMLGGAGAVEMAPNTVTDGGPTGLIADADSRRSTPLLALRAARQAIAKDPDHPDGYFALYLALSDTELPLSEGERTLGRVTALRQCLGRMPKPDRYKRGQYLASAFEVALTLAGTYLGDPIPGPTDPRTKQPINRGYFGMPVDVVPFNLILGQVILDNPRSPQAPVERRPFAVVQAQGGIPANLRPLSGLTPHVLALDSALEALALALEYLPFDTAGDTSDEVKRQVQRLEAARKEVEGALVQAGTQYGQAKARGADLPTLVEAAYRNGLTGEAYRLLTDKDTDLSKAYKERVAEADLLRVTLELVLGHVGDAHGSLAQFDQPKNAAAVGELKLTPLVRSLKYQKALAAGEYKLAGELLGEGQQVGVDPLMAAIAQNKIDPRDVLKGPTAAYLPWPPVTLERVLPVLGFQAALERSGAAVQAREQIVGKLDADARYFHQRGVMSLLEGDIRAAKRWFEQSSREPPAGWNLGRVVHPDSQRYLRLIELAEKKAAGP